MKKVVKLLFLLICLVLSLSFSDIHAEEDSSVTITVKVCSMYSQHEVFVNGASDKADAELRYMDSICGSFYYSGVFTEDLSSLEYLGGDEIKKWLDEEGKVDTDKFKPGWFKFYWNQDVRTGAIYGAINELGSYTITQTYTFTFPDPNDIRLKIESQGCILGKITRDDDSSSGWLATDWYRKRTSDPVYSSNGLNFCPDAGSSALYIGNSGGMVSDCTVYVYVGENPISINNGGTGFLDQNPSPDTSSTYYSEVSDNGNGFADGYSVGTADYSGSVSDNTWTEIRILVNNFINEINIISWFYYGIAFLTSVLMIVINIVKLAGTPNNPMMKSRIYIDVGISFLCLALLGASALLTRLFILTCLG